MGAAGGVEIVLQHALGLKRFHAAQVQLAGGCRGVEDAAGRRRGARSVFFMAARSSSSIKRTSSFLTVMEERLP